MDRDSWARAGDDRLPIAASRWAVLAQCPEAQQWLRVQADLGLAPRTLDAYSRGLTDYLAVCAREGIDPLSAGRAEIARYVRDLIHRPNPRGATIVSIDSGAGLANATLQQRLVVVRLFYDHLIEEGRRETNPVGRGRYTPGRAFGGHRERGLIPRFTKLPWIPTDDEWQQILARRAPRAAAHAPDAGPRLRRRPAPGGIVQPAHGRSRPGLSHPARPGRDDQDAPRAGRAVLGADRRPAAAVPGLAARTHRGPRRALFVSESRRNRAQPLTLWTWSKVVRALALRAGVARFSTHTLRHLCLTDLARSGWELHAIARFAGHRNVATTLQYIHLSGRELAAKLATSMAHVHTWRRAALAELRGRAGMSGAGRAPARSLCRRQPAAPSAPEAAWQWPIDVSRYDRSPRLTRAGSARARPPR